MLRNTRLCQDFKEIGSEVLNFIFCMDQGLMFRALCVRKISEFFELEDAILKGLVSCVRQS
jgi:hypothetical protein